MLFFLLFIEKLYSCKKIKSQIDIPITDLYKFSPVSHLNTKYKKSDLNNAIKNIELYQWAAQRNRSIINSAQGSLRRLKNESFIVDTKNYTINNHVLSELLCNWEELACKR